MHSTCAEATYYERAQLAYMVSKSRNTFADALPSLKGCDGLGVATIVSVTEETVRSARVFMTKF